MIIETEFEPSNLGNLIFNYFSKLLQNKYYSDSLNMCGCLGVIGWLNVPFGEIESGSYVRCESYGDNSIYLSYSNPNFDPNHEILNDLSKWHEYELGLENKSKINKKKLQVKLF